MARPGRQAMVTTSDKIFRSFYFASILFAPVYLGAVYLWSFSASALLLLFGLLATWSGHSRSDKPLWVQTGLESWILLYLALFAISFFSSQIPARSVAEGYKLIVIILTFYATAQFCRSRENIQTLCKAAIFTGGVLSFAGLLQYLGGLPNGWWHIRHFLSAAYVNHNHFAGFLELVLPVSLGFAVAERDLARKSLYGFLCVLMGIAFIFTLSRGGYVSISAAIIVMLVLLAWKGILKNAWLMPVALALLVLTASFFFGWNPVAARLESVEKIVGGDVSSVDRLLMWKGAWAVIAGHPWFGTGPGTFEFSFLKYRPDGFAGRPVFAHNDYLNLAADCGLPALAATAVLFVAMIARGLRIIRRVDSRLKAGVAAGCVASVTALSVHSLIDFNFHIPANWMWSAVVAGLLVSLDEKRRLSSPHRDLAVRIIALVGLLSVLAGVWFFGVSDFYLWNARRSFASHDIASAMDDVNRSLKINPFDDRAYYLRGTVLESAKPDAQRLENAMRDFKTAIKLNPLEPYYDYHEAMNFLFAHPDRLNEAAAFYRSAVEKDPRDPKLCYLAGNDLLRANKRHNKAIETFAKRLLNESMELDNFYAGLSYESLWGYEARPGTLEGFKARVTADWTGISWFFKRTDQWKDYRKYFLESLGIDPELKYKLLRSAAWADPPAAVFRLNEFSGSPRYKVFEGDCFYASGELSKEVRLEKKPARLVIRAKGSRAGSSYPVITVKLDGSPVDALYVDSPFYANFYSILEAVPGVHRLGIEYVNDATAGSPPVDRNVWIDTIELQYPKD